MANQYVQADDDIFHFLVFVHRTLAKPFEDHFRGKFTSLQLNALCVLCAGEPMTMSELAASLHTPRQQMSRMIEKLYEEGHIVRSLDKRDRRKIRISVSEATAKEIRDGREEFDKALKLAMEGFSEAEYRDFNAAVRIVNRILTKIPQKD
ncbi:MarR family winged helix-turn-helix transcriptional regulator [Caproiciproducens faecalis]|uniref:MarR family transcriptional regulator n=1 Tax=Caproiciproducens faecalis TaxID=2820301 RepID=A0ABS7DKW3_9FIRM|nr:MarR family transcriptional regulator [Caproiciproducens faecalis]MBW7571727.1 MarR family transcriptional regulator [Caproiciproducens faecalis]